MTKFVFFLLAVSVLFLFGFLMERALTEKAEYGYFQGQKDALTGDVRIQKVGDSCWVWTKSPWDDTHNWPMYSEPCGQ